MADNIEYSSFYCFNCGSLLKEAGLGFYHCGKCDSTFLPYESEGNQCFECVNVNDDADKYIDTK